MMYSLIHTVLEKEGFKDIRITGKSFVTAVDRSGKEKIIAYQVLRRSGYYTAIPERVRKVLASNKNSLYFLILVDREEGTLTYAGISGEAFCGGIFEIVNNISKERARKLIMTMLKNEDPNLKYFGEMSLSEVKEIEEVKLVTRLFSNYTIFIPRNLGLKPGDRLEVVIRPVK